MSKISELSDGGSLVSSDYLIAVRSGGNVKVRMDQINVDQVDLGDNEFIRLGNSQDLTMVHTSTQSIINQAGIGDLLLQKAGATKLTINATGIDVTGTVTADGLTVDGNAVIDGGATDNTVLTLDSGTANTYLKMTDSNSTNGTFIGATTDDLNLYPNNTLSAKFSAGGDISFYEDTGTTPKFFWDASEESLGIGTSSPSSFSSLANDFVVNGATTAGITISESTGSGSSNILFAATSGFANRGNISYDHTATAMTFGINATERMRIDASGNLLVGTTDDVVWNNNANSAADNGSNLRADGRAGFSSYQVTASSNATVNINRTGSDGDAIRFFKSGALVGSIGVAASNNLYIGSSATDHTGLVFPDDAILPAKELAATDNFVDLGSSSRRFKALYLSAGVVFGTTGGSVSSKTLDDYEEGTWTPALSFDVGGGSVTYTTLTGSYVKIGKTVTVTFLIEGISGVSSSDYYARLVLPFGTASTNQKIRTRVHNTGNTDFWVTTAGGTTPVMYASSAIADYARGDDLNGRSISATFTYETA